MPPKWLKTSSSACTKQLCCCHSPLYSSVLCSDDERWGEQVHITGASQSNRALGLNYIEKFFSNHTNITSTMHFFTCLSRLVQTSHIISFISLCKTLCLWRSKSFWIWWCVDCWYCCRHVQDSYQARWIELLLNGSCYVPINMDPYP